jgi:hypothetical protein
MRYVIYEDERGYMIKDNDPDDLAECGIPAGPPDLRGIDIDWLMKELNNVLVSNKLFTWDDVQRMPGGIQPALNTFKRTLIALYRQDSKNES